MNVLVAGIGNIFLGDDAFGVEVVRRLHDVELPDEVDVADYGIRGIHLAYELLDGCYDSLILIDAVPLQDAPGTIEIIDALAPDSSTATGPVDAHSMSPDVVLGALRSLGGSIDRVLIVGCQPADLSEGIGLSDTVSAACQRAVPIVCELARAEAARTTSSAAISPSGGANLWMPSRS